MLYLPNTTPNYMLYIETNLDSLYISTLKLHLCYINKVINMKPHRLPRILALEIIERNIYWAKEWENLCQNIQFYPDNTMLCRQWKPLLNHLKIKERNVYTQNAKSSQFHDLYYKLNYNVSSLYTSNFSPRVVSLIIKARGGLLNLNARSFRNNTVGICTLCNLDASENTTHFIGVCPVYKEFRVQYFGKAILNENEVICLLNGLNYYSLYKYIDVCLKYRKLILNEFVF